MDGDREYHGGGLMMVSGDGSSESRTHIGWFRMEYFPWILAGGMGVVLFCGIGYIKLTEPPRLPQAGPLDVEKVDVGRYMVGGEYMRVERFVADGHSWVWFNGPYTGEYSVVHDPDCECHIPRPYTKLRPPQFPEVKFPDMSVGVSDD